LTPCGVHPLFARPHWLAPFDHGIHDDDESDMLRAGTKTPRLHHLAVLPAESPDAWRGGAVSVPDVPTRRRQLTLFVEEPWRSRLQALRRALDLVQASLIAPHVTLCREDEIEQLDQSTIFSRVAAWTHGAHLTLAHPRNPRAVGNTEAALAACPPALQIQFTTVALIEQHGAAPWTVLQESLLPLRGLE
jgi:hypothetical protein